MRRAVLAVLLLLALPAPLASAADNPERARQAVEAGEAKPLDTVLQAIAKQHPGRALDAELLEQGGSLIYRIKWLGTDDQVRDITADAKTGKILESR